MKEEGRYGTPEPEVDDKGRRHYGPRWSAGRHQGRACTEQKDKAIAQELP